jgi:probable addiction module antidote protein
MKNPRQGREFQEYVQDFIRDPSRAAEYLNAAAEDGDSAAFLIALKDVLDVHGSLSALSRETGLNRANLHKMLGGKSSPRMDTLKKVLRSVGLRFTIEAINAGTTAGSRSRAHLPQAERHTRRAATR